MTNIYAVGTFAVVAVIFIVLFMASRCVRYVGNNRVAIVDTATSLPVFLGQVSRPGPG